MINFLPVNYKIFINYPLNSPTKLLKSILFIITGDALPQKNEYFSNVGVLVVETNSN